MNQKGFKKINWNIMLVLFIYCFVTVTHIAMLQSFRSDNFSINHPTNSIFKRKEISAATNNMVLRRMEKVVIEDKNISLAVVIIAIGTSLLFLVSFFDVEKRRKNRFPADQYAYCSHQYAYITLRTFRI